MRLTLPQHVMHAGGCSKKMDALAGLSLTSWWRLSIVAKSGFHRTGVGAMTGRFLGWLGCAAVVSCCIASWGQSTERDAARTDPRQFDATSFGERVILGPNWLFA